LLKNSERANREKTDPVPVVKLFTPHADCVWLVAEIHPDDGDTALGLIDTGRGYPAIGYFRLSKITDPSKPPVYKDLNFRFRPKRPPVRPSRDRHDGRVHRDLGPGAKERFTAPQGERGFDRTANFEGESSSAEPSGAI
jgi:hypothetical protein